MVSAVARVFEPGCKADCCLILEGPQGIKKSTALRVLAEPWFTDEIADLGSKDAALQTRGVWVIEIAELDSMSRSEVGRIKAFMSRSTDRFRPPYGKRPIESPRQCVFAGSVNHSTYLRDETGGRRFWPVECQAPVIDVDALARDRDQLWAEAVSLYFDGNVWWLDSVELNRQAADEQADRYEGDPWDELILAWVAGRDSVSINEVLTLCLDRRKDQWTQWDKIRVARCLRAHGWERFKAWGRGEREWRYRRIKE
jgi:predicted P-loop ATPase